MDLLKKLRIVREAGHVERAHNVPHHGSYSVGKHSYDVVSILLLLHPSPSNQLIRAALWHDMPERFLGDLPAPAKWYNPKLNKQYQDAEQSVLDRFGEHDLMSRLTLEETDWLHAADRLELLMWADDQLALGNRHIEPLRANVIKWFEHHSGTTPAPILSILNDLSFVRIQEDMS